MGMAVLSGVSEAFQEGEWVRIVPSGSLENVRQLADVKAESPILTWLYDATARAYKVRGRLVVREGTTLRLEVD